MTDKKPYVLGISGVAGSGKDTMADLLIKQFKNIGFRAAKLALAEPLKKSCKSFIFNEFNIDIDSNETEKKNIVRGILVETASVHRKLSQGSYYPDIWINKWKDIKDIDFLIASDLRFDEFGETDELQKFKKLGAYIIHIDRIKDGKFLEPPNETESENAPKIKNASDLQVVWNSDNKIQKSIEVFDKVLKHFEIKI